jgi:hypothetical protein
MMVCLHVAAVLLVCPAAVTLRVRHRWLRRLCTSATLLHLASYGSLTACFLTFDVRPAGMLTPDVTSDALAMQAFALFIAALRLSLKSQAEKYYSLIYCERKILYHG